MSIVSIPVGLNGCLKVRRGAQALPSVARLPYWPLPPSPLSPLWAVRAGAQASRLRDFLMLNECHVSALR